MGALVNWIPYTSEIEGCGIFLYDGGENRKQVVSMKWVERHGRLTIIQDYMC